MRRFKSILFVADGTEGEKSALARAAGLASANGARLTLFAALDAELYPFGDPEILSAIEAMNELHIEQRREELESLRRDAVGRSGVPGLLIGNTAERVLNAVDCSVLALKPEGFETPIQV